MSTPGGPPPPQDPGGYGAQGHGLGQSAGGYGQEAPGYGYGPPPAQQNNTPLVLGIIGLVCWFLCSPASIVLGLIGASKARESSQSDTLPKIAWIGGIVALVLGIITTVVRLGGMS